MKVPSYVPIAVSKYITAYLYGDDWEPEGWVSLLEKANMKLDKIQTQFDSHNLHQGSKLLANLYREKRQATDYRDSIEDEVECLKRLLLDLRMKNVFLMLSKVFENDKQWEAFIHAAWSSRLDYSKQRDKIKKVKDLKDSIVTTANDLYEQLKEIEDIGYDKWPSEFFSIPKLLKDTDNHENKGHNLQMWRRMRSYILGEIPDSGKANQIKPTKDIKVEYVKSGEKIQLSNAEENRNTLSYAWNTAPHLSSILLTVIKAGKEFEPMEDGIIGAAISTREENIKTDYLRAFKSKLFDIQGNEFSADFLKSIAITANVVINSEEIDVSHGDVRKTKILPVD